MLKLLYNYKLVSSLLGTQNLFTEVKIFARNQQMCYIKIIIKNVDVLCENEQTKDKNIFIFVKKKTN